MLPVKEIEEREREERETEEWVPYLGRVLRCVSIKPKEV